MGYDLHITRKQNWSDPEGPAISEAEWRALGPADEALRWEDGEVVAKNPGKELIGRMVALARELGAKVQGDDGEIYRENGSHFEEDRNESAAAPARPGLMKRIAQGFRARRALREAQDQAPQFRVGQRVNDPWKQPGTVIAVDRNANAGMGSVRVRLDTGHEQTWSCIHSGITPIEDGTTPP
jgi:hypothetical protein